MKDDFSKVALAARLILVNLKLKPKKFLIERRAADDRLLEIQNGQRRTLEVKRFDRLHQKCVKDLICLHKGEEKTPGAYCEAAARCQSNAMDARTNRVICTVVRATSHYFTPLLLPIFRLWSVSRVWIPDYFFAFK